MRPVFRFTIIGSTLFAALMLSNSPPAVGGIVSISDSLYLAHHPRILFTTNDLPDLRNKVLDGGHDDAAYAFIRRQVTRVYPTLTQDSLLSLDMGLEEIPNLGLVAHMDVPFNQGSAALGWMMTYALAANYDVSDDAYWSSLCLRSLVLGYDMCFSNAPEALRATVVEEICSYIDRMTQHINYTVWWNQPYTSNKAAMIVASLGLAAICLQGEVDSEITDRAFAASHGLFEVWLDTHVEAGGACREGALYGAWSMRHLAYYFYARQKYDGFDYSNVYPQLRNMENWFAYELDPRGGGRVNNIHDCTELDYPLARHTTYFDWAQAQWGSALSAYIWERVAIPFGNDQGDHADKFGTALWAQPLIPQQPDDVLANSRFWPGRGLYYYRSGWPAAGASDDVVISFYSGEFKGGHAQEDQNQFTLAAFGQKLVADHGPGRQAAQSEAHNMVFIDGMGQHHAGMSIGTDGNMTTRVLGVFADQLVGDATAAYSTYSPLNAPNAPFPGSDWSWGYIGANPVNHARRTVAVVHGVEAMLYMIVVDDIEKDGGVHDYQWRLHTPTGGTVDVGANPVRINHPLAALEVHVLNPSFDQVTAAVAPFDNANPEPDTDLLTLNVSAVNPQFVTMLVPVKTGVAAPSVSTDEKPWGAVTTIAWSASIVDVVVVNLSRQMSAASTPSWSVYTDAFLAVLRLKDGQLDRYLATDVSSLWVSDTEYIRIEDGTANVSRGEARIDMDRADAQFVFYAPDVNEVYGGGTLVPTANQNGLVTPLVASAANDNPRAQGPVSVVAAPNPFNPSTSIKLALSERGPVTVEAFDVRGRLVRRLWHNRAAGPGTQVLEWDGRDGRGHSVASGVYFVRARTRGGEHTVKITVLK